MPRAKKDGKYVNIYMDHMIGCKFQSIGASIPELAVHLS